MRTSILVVFHIFVLFLHFSESQHCLSDKLQGDILNSTTACYYEHRQCSFPALQAAHPHLFNKTAWKQPKVVDFKLTSFCKLDAHGTNQSGLNIQWKFQDIYGAHGIEGFEVRVEGYMPDFRCDVMVFNEPVSRDKISTIFTGTLNVTRGKSFRVTIISLPRTNDSFLEYKDVKSIACDRGKSSDSWYSKTNNYTYDWYKQVLNVTFDAPPKVYNITQFRIAILSTSFPFQQSKISNSTHVVFHDVKPGNYRVTMQPYDPYRHDKDRCVCRNDEGLCNTCCQSEWNIKIKKPETEPTQDTADISVALLPVIVLFFLIICVIIFVTVIAPRCGIQFHVEDCCFGTSEKSNILCVDASNSSDIAATFKKLIHREFKYCHRSTVNYRHVTYTSDTCDNFEQLLKEFRTDSGRNSILPDLCCNKYQNVNQNKKIVVCLLVKDLLQEITSDVYCKLGIEMAKLQAVHCDLLVIYSVCSSNLTVDKAFKLSDEKSLVAGIRNAMDETDTLADGENPSLAPEPNTRNRSSVNFPCTIAIKEVEHNYNGHEEYYSPPCTNHLCIPENQNRGRYLSNDSGHGASPKEWNGSFNEMYDEYDASRGGQQLGAMAEVQHPYYQRSNSGTFSWIAPSICAEDAEDFDQCGESTTMDFIGNEMLAINEDARTVCHGKA